MTRSRKRHSFLDRLDTMEPLIELLLGAVICVVVGALLVAIRARPIVLSFLGGAVILFGAYPTFRLLRRWRPYETKRRILVDLLLLTVGVAGGIFAFWLTFCPC